LQAAAATIRGEGEEQGDGGAGGRGRHLLVFPFLAPMPPCGGCALVVARGNAAAAVQEPAPRTTTPSSLSSSVRHRPLKRKEGSCSGTPASSLSRSWSHRRLSKTRWPEHQEHHAAHACVVAADDKVYREFKPACPHRAEPPQPHGVTPNRLQAHGEPTAIYLPRPLGVC
jgi:hypothetical protein